MSQSFSPLLVSETEFEKSSASALVGANRRPGRLASDSVARPCSNGPPAWLSMPVIVLLQADWALCSDDLLEGRGRQLLAALARRVAGGDDQDVQPVDPVPADLRVRPRATAPQRLLQVTRRPIRQSGHGSSRVPLLLLCSSVAASTDELKVQHLFLAGQRRLVAPRPGSRNCAFHSPPRLVGRSTRERDAGPGHQCRT